MPQAFTHATALLDYNSVPISDLTTRHGWASLPPYERIGAIYDFVRNDIKFGYNRADNIPASEVLSDGYGQCNTKATLLMALLRAVDVPCRLHGFTIKKSLQQGVVPPLVYPLAPKSILHSWVEVFYNGAWVNLEGFILDDAYLAQIQARFLPKSTALCGYGVGTERLDAPGVNWAGESTYIQQTGINQDFGVFETPNAFYRSHRQALSKPKNWLYRHVIRHWMNARVAKIRAGKWPFF